LPGMFLFQFLFWLENHLEAWLLADLEFWDFCVNFEIQFWL